MPRIRRRAFRSSLALLLPVLAAACASSGSPASPAAGGSPVPTEVVREVYGAQQPESAKGQELYLYRVVIPPGEQIPAHTHPGLQFGHIVEGELTYQVVEGTVEVVRQAGRTRNVASR